MRALDDEGLGAFDRRLPWGSYGMLVRASLTAPTLGLALARWCRHHNLLTQGVRLRLLTQGQSARVQLTEIQPLGGQALAAHREFFVVSLLRNVLGVACWLTDSRISLQATHLALAPPAHAASYALLFDGPTHFEGAPQGHKPPPAVSTLSFDVGYLALPVRRDEAALHNMLQRALLLTVRPYKRDRLLVDKVRQTLHQHPTLTHSARALAAHLHLSARTLHRQLHEEGASLQAIKDKVRQTKALDLLLRSTRPLKDIAAEVGFQNEKSFLRAFKSWTGQTPDAVRAQGGLA